MEYQCSVCGQKVSGDMLVYREHTEKHIVDLVKHDHPDWVEASGLCQKCVEYYRAELKGSIFKDAPCALRIRKVKKFLSILRNIFKKPFKKDKSEETL